MSLVAAVEERALNTGVSALAKIPLSYMVHPQRMNRRRTENVGLDSGHFVNEGSTRQDSGMLAVFQSQRVSL